MVNQSQKWPVRPALAWYAVAILAAAHMMAIVDRQVIAVLVGPIQADLGISDTGISLLGGFMFAVFFAVTGLPLSYLSDRYSRKWIVAAGIFGWSVMTAACGLASSFVQLLLARIGVAVGEASESPTAPSLILDLFPQKSAGRAMGFYTFGTAFGAGLALLGGGALLTLATWLANLQIIPGWHKPWQIVFLLVSLPGIVVAAFALTLPEPRKTLSAKSNSAREAVRDALSIVPFLREHRAIYVPLMVGFALAVMAYQATLFWVPTLYVRSFGVALASSGVMAGMVLLICGIAGGLLGGWRLDAIRAADMREAAVRAALPLLAVMIPAVAVMPLAPTPVISIACYCVFITCMYALGTIVPTAVVGITPTAYRSRVAAVNLLVGHVIGGALGPTAVALLTDFVFRESAALPISLAIVCGVTLIGSLVLLRRARRCSGEPGDSLAVVFDKNS